MAKKTADKKTRVGCTVDSCSYWGFGNVCEADEIMVKNNIDSADMEIGTMDTLDAATSEETMCATYKPKQK